MKRNIALLLLASTTLLFACGESGTTSESSSASSEEPSTSSEQSVYFQTLTTGQEFYSISYDYTMTDASGSVTYAYGYSDQRLYVAVDEDGADVKIRLYQGENTTYVPSLDENPTSSSESWSVYHTPTRTYVQQSNGGYSNVQEAHPESDFAPLSLGFDFSQAQDYGAQASGYMTVVTPTFENDAKAVSFLGTSLGSAEAASGVTDLAFSVSLNSNNVIAEATATFKKAGYNYSFYWRTSTVNAPLTLPDA